MFNLLLDENTRDLVLSSSKNLSLIYSPNVSAQRIECRTRTIQGEWFLNNKLGIPYFTQVLVKTKDKSKVDSIFKNAILELSEVIKIENFVSTITSSREYKITTLSVKVESGETIEAGEE